MTDADANDKMVKAATVFSPRSPVYRRAFFAGRSAQMNALADAVSQIGLHAVIFGERGVGKSSLGNITQDLLDVMDKADKVPRHTRQCKSRGHVLDTLGKGDE